MATGGTFDVKFTADSSDLRSELEKVSKSLDNVADSTSGATNDMRKGLDGAKKSAEGLAKKVPSVGTAAKPVNDKLRQTGQNAQEATDRLANMEGAAGQASSSMSGLAGALSLISPEAGAAAQAIADTAGGLEAAARGGTRVFAILGPVALAVATAGAAYVHFRGDLDAANAALETQRSKLEAVQDMHRKVKEAVLLAALANEEITQTEFDAIAAAQSAKDLTAARREELTKERNALEQRRLELGANTDAEVEAIATSAILDAQIAATGGRMMSFTTAQKAAKVTTNAYSESRAQLTAEMKRNKTQLDILDETERRYAKAITDSKSKIEERTVVATQAAAIETEQADGRFAALEQLRAIKARHLEADMTAAELLVVRTAEEIASIHEIRDAHSESWAVKGAALDAEESARNQLRKDQGALDAKAQKDLRADEEKTQKEIRAQREATIRATMSANTDLLSSSSDMFMQLSTMNAEHDKGTARKLFDIWRALAYAHIAFKTAEGYMTAASLPPPASFIKAGAVTAANATATMIVATTKAPFHAGSSFVRAPDRTSEINARLRAGEAVSTPLGAEILGRDNIAAANAGIGAAGTNAPIVFQYEHRAFTRFIRDNVRGVAGGLASEIHTGRTIGQRPVR